jgi:tetratricopeptide (TPR) repeat protein
MVSRLQRHLPVLGSGPRDLPAHQQTLHDTIAWSYDLLLPEEQRLFRRLAVFVGGCTLESVEAIAIAAGDLALDPLDGLGSLVDKSLLRQAEDNVDGEPRFGMLQTIREYSLERLVESGEEEALLRAHTAYNLALAEQAEPELMGSQQTTWTERLELEHDNMRAVLQRARRGTELETGLRMATALSRFWVMHGYLGEGRAWMEQLLALAQSARDLNSSVLLAKEYRSAGTLAFFQGDFGPASTLGEQSLALYQRLDDQQGTAEALQLLSNAAVEQGDYQHAAAAYEESLALRRAIGDRWGMASVLNSLGILAWYQNDYALAMARYEESLA